MGSTDTTRVRDAATTAAELSGRAARLCRRALDAGADQAEVYSVRSQKIGVTFEKGDLKLSQVDDGSTLGVRVFKGGKLGFASTNQASDEALAGVARDALALCALNPPDDANRLPATRAAAPALDLIDPAIQALGIEEVVDYGQRFLDRAAQHDARLAIDKASVELHFTTHSLVNSEGVELSESDAALGTSIFGMAIDGDDVGGFHYTGDNIRRASRIEASLASAADEFAEVCLGNLNTGVGESYNGPVLFAPDAVLDLFVAPVVSAASAIAVQRGRSALKGKLGESIAHESFQLLDDPTDLALTGAASFDREGQPIGAFPIVENGVLASYLYNAYAAAVEGRESTGHAVGGARGLPGLGPHALSMAPGQGGDRDALLRSMGRGLYVMRFSGSIDPASGDFSGVAKSARWVEGGQVVRSVREILISGNAFELLRRFVALSSTAPTLHGAARAPWALVDGVSVTAG
ncbi:MAG: TldD/PmbA family protein [Planctomycetes bacterium]|nr:TldD/PmbA family protein [Planctomycetota bacterium]